MSEGVKRVREKESVLTERERALIKELAGDIRLSSTPFSEIGEKAGFSPEEVLQSVGKWKKEGLIRRFGAVLGHYQAGISSNVMIVWKVPKNKSKEIGEIMASFSAVSHCYERPSFPQWPYNLYTMVHGKSRNECWRVAEAISEETGIKEYQLLFSAKEYKKTSMSYFGESGFW